MVNSTMQAVRSIVHARTGVMVHSGDERLAAVIPNSMAFIGVLTACEEELGVRLDYSELTHGTTFDQFVGLIERARKVNHPPGKPHDE